MGRFLLLLRIAFRNLFSSPMNLIIGGIILAGTFLVVVGGALLDSVDSAMSRSIIGSVAGHIQVYSAKSKDDLALFGGFGAEPDLDAVDNFSSLKKTLLSVPNVKTVVPMGINGALVTSGNTLDLALAHLRELEKQPKVHAEGQNVSVLIESEKRHVKQMISLLQTDLQKMEAVSTDAATLKENAAVVARASSNEFWSTFDQEPFGSLEFLENKIAPLAADSDVLYLRYVGTDFDAFQRSFDRMQIADGEAVPPGKRGFLFSKYFYEERVKLKTARRLDKINEAITEKHKTIAGDPELQRFIKENQAQTREILFQLDDLKTGSMTERLQKALGSQEKDLNKLLVSLLTTDDANFSARYKLFYAEVAPFVELYRIRIGDTLTIKAFTRTGFVQSVNVKVYGTFDFNGLEKSPLAGGLNLMDMFSFRDLYGYLSADKLEENEKIKQAAGAKMLDRDKAEDSLFGGSTDPHQVVAEATPGIIDERKELDGKARLLRSEDLVKRVYSQQDLENGVVLNAAVILKDPSRIDQTLKDIDAAASRDHLSLKAVSWQKASGLIGQFVLISKLVLYFAVFIIFIVALVIINNAMMMATLQRVKEIGTLRAIGARKSFVLSLILTETVVLGLVFGATGALLGSLVVKILGSYGIPAFNDVMYFFFSGPRLLPALEATNIISAFAIVVVVSAISTFYPAFLATRVAPVVAMQTEE